MNDDYLCHHGVIGQKWGIRRYQSYSTVPRKSGKRGKELPQIKQARKIYQEAKRREPKITNDVGRSVERCGAHMYGLENRLKTQDSIARKLASKDIKDAVRYTAILSDKNFVKQYSLIKSQMESNGYSESKCKNYFEQYRQGKVNHKSVQCNFKTPDGYTFEIQFQTKSSQKAKDKKVPLYEEARNPNTTEQRRKQLIKQMRLLADDVNDPPGIEDIKEH